MFHIALCSNNITICSELERIILNYNELFKKNIALEIYYSENKLYENLKKKMFFDLIFLDIDTNYLNGIQIGKNIRQELHNEEIEIIFFSKNKLFSADIFEARPLNFLLTPFNPKKVINILMKLHQSTNKQYRAFAYKQGHSIKILPIQDILYFESMNRHIKIVTTTNDMIYYYDSLKNIYPKVKNANFFYCHRSYIINYNHIRKYDYNHITMSNKDEIPISQSNKKIIKKIIYKYI